MARRLVIGDIHGCLRSFRKLLENKIHLETSDSLYLVGDYIDRGPDSKGVLDYLFELQDKDHQLFPIKGNHEVMMLDALGHPPKMSLWFYNGAKSTLGSFGLKEHHIYSGESSSGIPQKYIEFLKELPYYYRLEDAFIVHAGFSFYSEDPFGDEQSMIWSREMEYDLEKADGLPVIHGHTPVTVEKIQATLSDPTNKLINIDAGCVYNQYPGYGNLVGLDIDSRELFVQGNID